MRVRGCESKRFGSLRHDCVSHTLTHCDSYSLVPAHSASQIRSTCTRLSKNVAPLPRSVRRVGVVELQLLPPRLCLFHQMLGETTTPGRTLSPTKARAMKEPRSLNTLTKSPC